VHIVEQCPRHTHDVFDISTMPLIVRWAEEILYKAASVRESGLALLGLVLAGALAYGAHVVHGGFYSDDWNNYAIYAYDSGGRSVGEVLHRFAELTAFRPFLVFYVPLTDLVFGLNSHLHLAWAVFLGCLMAAALFRVLRLLGLEQRHAAGVSALFLLFPASDATRLWSTSAHASLAVAFFLIGLGIALGGVRSTGMRAVLCHAAALVFYFLALTCHELVAPGILAAFLLYRLHAGSWRPALARWAPDLILLVATVKLITTSGTNPAQPLGPRDMFFHAIEIARQAVSIASEALMPLNAPKPLLAAGGVAVLLVVSLVVRATLPEGDPARAMLRRWLLIGGAGLLAAGIAYLIFVPAPRYGAYEPLAVGVGKRVNLLAGAGWALFAYSVIQVVATLVFRSLPGSARWIGRAAAVAAVGLILAYGLTELRHAEEWDRAADIQAHVVAVVRAEVPDPRPSSVIFTAGHRAYSAPGVPAAAFYYDLNGALKVAYDDGSLEAYPIVEDTKMRCFDSAMEAVRSYRYEDASRTSYGHAYLVNVEDETVTVPRDRRSCERAVARNPAGPLQESAGFPSP